jgi:hypothetical protein
MSDPDDLGPPDVVPICAKLNEHNNKIVVDLPAGYPLKRQIMAASLALEHLKIEELKVQRRAFIMVQVPEEK